MNIAYFQLSCLREDVNSNSFVAETVIYIIFPVAVVFLSGACAYCFTARGQENALENALETAYSSGIGVAVVTAYLMQPTLIKRFSLFFACTKMGSAENDYFLNEDLSIRCYDTEHMILIWTLALPLLFYVIGIPFVIWLVLRPKGSQELLARVIQIERLQVECDLNDPIKLNIAAEARANIDPATQIFESSYAFLFLGYRQSTYIWEIVVMTRKAVLAILGVALAHEPRTQVIMLYITSLTNVVHSST